MTRKRLVGTIAFLLSIIVVAYLGSIQEPYRVDQTSTTTWIGYATPIFVREGPLPNYLTGEPVSAMLWTSRYYFVKDRLETVFQENISLTSYQISGNGIFSPSIYEFYQMMQALTRKVWFYPKTKAFAHIVSDLEMLVGSNDRMYSMSKIGDKYTVQIELPTEVNSRYGLNDTITLRSALIFDNYFFKGTTNGVSVTVQISLTLYTEQPDTLMTRTWTQEYHEQGVRPKIQPMLIQATLITIIIVAALTATLPMYVRRRTDNYWSEQGS